MATRYADPPRPTLGTIEWGPIFAAVLTGLGLTFLLVSLGTAAGLTAADQGAADAGLISTVVGTWTVVSALVGTLAGSFVGGRLMRSAEPGPALYHGLTSWATATVLGVILGISGVAGLLGAALRSPLTLDEQVRAQQAGAEGGETLTAVAWGGWALFAGLALTLLAALLGWWAGASTRRRIAHAEAAAGAEPVGRRERVRVLHEDEDLDDRLDRGALERNDDVGARRVRPLDAEADADEAKARWDDPARDSRDDPPPGATPRDRI